ncbi:MAG: aquaporin, partial [Phototrophicales bacterium]
MKETIAEFIGTFILIFIGCLSVILANSTPNINVLVPAFAHGFAVIAIIYTYGHISGAHVNPAVTLALLVGNQVTFAKAIFYMVAQFVASILAVLLIVAILGNNDN